MFAADLALLCAVAFVHATQVKPIEVCDDHVRQQDNWTLHANAPSSVILDHPLVDTPSSLILDDLRMQCPSSDHIGVLIPVEGANPKQYTLQFSQNDAQLPEGAIYYVKCLGSQPDALRT